MAVSPKISVIIPTYNRAHLIGETIASVLAQTFTDFELVIVDDGSTDDTKSLVGAIDDQRIQYMHIDNSGQSVASNTGIMAAQGEYMTLLDSDDLWEPNFLEVMYTHLTSQHEHDFCYCNYHYFDEGGLIFDEFIDFEKRIDGSLFELFMEGTLVCTGSYLMKREHMIEAGMLDPSIPVVTDWDLWLRISAKYTATYVDQCLLRVRKHQDRLSHQITEMARCNLVVLYRIKSNYPDAFKKHMRTLMLQLKRNHRMVAGDHRRKSRYLTAAFHYFKSL